MRKIVVASDSFKGSVSSIEVAASMIDFQTDTEVLGNIQSILGKSRNKKFVSHKNS